jgi:small subunit ribosomal protein S17
MPTKKTTTKKVVKEVKAVEAAPSKTTVLSGVVTSTKMQKTIVVKVTNFVKHPKYQKYLTITKKYKAHDENSVAKVGDKVKIVETRPISKDKHFKLVEGK